MFFDSELQLGILLKRYKRFLADVRLADGQVLTVHCPNTGSMRSCSEPGSPVALSLSENPKRKYPHTLELIKAGGVWIGVNTARTNSLVAEAILAGKVSECRDVQEIRREVKVSAGSRLDLEVRMPNSRMYIEVKNCSLVEGQGLAMFPDAVTSRGTRHLRELASLALAGHEAAIFFLVQREDADRFAPARHIDPVYADTLRDVAAKGVQVLAYQASVSPAGIEVSRRLPCHLD